ncbi:MAG: hypothetical protein JWP87_1756 [Labilithrix sp.]|nr:hypothetical protein [Labilithrix sp.]
MGVSSSRARVLALLIVPSLAACGVFLDIAEEPPSEVVPPDGGQDGQASAEGGVEGAADGPLDPCVAAGDCTPQLLTKLSGAVKRLVVSGSSLYIAHDTTAEPRVVRVAADAPAATFDLDPHATGPDVFGGSSSIAVDPSGAIYWGTPNGLRRHEADAGADASADAGITSLSDLGAPVSGVRIADGRLHFAVFGPQGGAGVNTGHLASCALPGCGDVQVSGYTPYPLDLVAIGATRWWLATDNSFQNLALRTVGQVIPGEQQSPSRMVTDGALIYWSTTDGLRMFTVQSRMLVDLLPVPTAPASRVNGVALDPTGSLYVTQESKVKRCTIANGKCTFTDVATTAGTAVEIAADATTLYWGTTDGSVWRVAKP